jgi:acetyl-CoA acyltransferase
VDAYIAEAARTPFGSYFGTLSGVRADDLLAMTIKSLLKKVPRLESQAINDVVIGDSNGSGEDNRNVARMGLLLAGLPVTVPGVTVNRLCGSGGEAIIQASREIRTGDAQFILAGGVESMSRAPWIISRTTKKTPESLSIDELHQSTVGWRMVNPAFPSHWTQSLGRCAE